MDWKVAKAVHEDPVQVVEVLGRPWCEMGEGGASTQICLENVGIEQGLRGLQETLRLGGGNHFCRGTGQCNGSCVPGRVGGGGQGGRPVREVVGGHRDPHELGFSPSDGGTTEGL